MKIYVYAICKNEGRFVHRWMQSMSEADGVYVLDTGSEDDSAEQLRAYGANVVSESVTPWRFDTARNRSLALVPADADICVCTDLDEVFLPGWRTALEAAWKPGTNCAQYRYVWSFHDDGSEGTVFYICKVHARTGFAWKHPVHEVLVKTDGLPEVSVTVPGMQLNHYPDPAKSRASYLPLLEYSVQEDPADDRNMHYLGREYFYYGRWEACMETLKRHLQLPSATWRDERAASMRYIARASAQLGRENEAHSWFLRAVAEAPHLRLIVDHWGGGRIDAEAAERHGITIARVPESYGWIVNGVADLVWGLMICVGRRFEEGSRFIKDGKFTHSEQSNHLLLGQGLCGRTLGILGAGRIGRAVAARSGGFGMELIYYDIRPNPEAGKNVNSPK